MSHLRIEDLWPDLFDPAPYGRSEGWMPLNYQDEAQTAFLPTVVQESSPPGPPRLRWSRNEGHRSPDISESLWSFLTCATGSDDEVMDVAKRWGALGICKHGLPYLHAEDCHPLSWENRGWMDPEERSAPHDPAATTAYWEPLAAWRFYARRFNAVLALALAARDGEPPDPRLVLESLPLRLRGGDDEAVWSGRIFAPYDDEVLHAFEAQMASTRTRSARFYVSHAVDRLISETGASMRFAWLEDEPEPQWVISGFINFRDWLPQEPSSPGVWVAQTEDLFPILVAQLVAAVEYPHGLGRCSVCGAVAATPSGRAARTDRRQLCHTCRDHAKKARRRDYMRRKRAEEREQQSLRPGAGANVMEKASG